MCTKKIIMKLHNFPWHVGADGKHHSFLGHVRNVSWGDVVYIPRKKKHAHMTETLLELNEWVLLFYFIILIWWMIDLDWHVHQKDYHKTAQLSMICQKEWKTA